MLLPALNKARATARHVACINGLKQIGVAVASYGVDYEHSFPVYETGPNTSWSSWGYMGPGLEKALVPYLGGTIPSQGWLPTGFSTWICPASPISYNADDGKYYHDGISTGNSYQRNSYEGLYYHYKGSDINSDNSPGNPGAINFKTFSRPDQTPFQFCSRRESAAWELPHYASFNVGNGLLGAASWHDQYTSAKRPTLFADAHVRSLTSPLYTDHGRQDIMLGSYSTWQLETGTGTPPHTAFDFWIEEY
jgi:hypothetical protein